jgi:polyphosphate kinase
MSGVKITMILRGISCLLPKIPGLTENITIISIVGRFLEHSRIFCFGKGDGSFVCISSGDLMTRNTERRIEVACPVLDADIKRRICDMLETMILDNTKAWELFPDGKYVLRQAPADLVISSQELFVEQARKQVVVIGTGKRANKEKRGVASFVAQPLAYLGRIRSLLKRK